MPPMPQVTGDKLPSQQSQVTLRDSSFPFSLLAVGRLEPQAHRRSGPPQATVSYSIEICQAQRRGMLA